MDTITKAKINLFAVLRNLEDLCAMDKKSAEIIKDSKIAVQFNVTDVGSATIKFENGKCTFIRGKQPASLKLYFTSPEHFNKLIDGEKTVPIFFNVFKVNFLLKTFTQLADRLNYYLKPTEELLADSEYFKINTYLTAYTAFHALCEIGNSDEIGKLNASRIPDGQILAYVEDGPSMVITVDKKHHMAIRKGTTDTPRAIMKFSDLKTANDILNGKSDIWSNMGAGRFAIHGYLPMMDNMSKILAQVGRYLQ